MYMCIGTDDFLLATNRKYRDFLLEEKVDLTYEEGPEIMNGIFGIVIF